jgi:Rrf2 family protein
VLIACKASIDSKISIKTVAEELDIPTPYLGKILQKLTKNNIIQSVKGPNGGFYVEEKGQKISIIRIIQVMDGLDFFTTCGLGMKECSDEHPCPLHDEYKIYKEHLWKLFNNKTVADMVASIKNGNSFIKNLPLPDQETE